MERISRFRAILLLILFCSILALFALKLFDLQIIKTNGNTDNIAKYTTVTTVRAARGDILDRNGNKLVGNRASYNLVFNHYVIESYGQTNEALYSLIKMGGADFDVIVPSDYMIARLIQEDMLAELDYSHIPNFQLIDDTYKNLSYDPENKYTVPYTWGMVGLVYNTKYVTAEEASTWDVLWNEKFKGKVLMFGNSRDAFGIALKKLGYSLNTENLEEIDKAADALKAQKAVNQMYAMDQTFDKMANENAYAAPYYAGDCLTMMERNENLAFSYPKEGVNQFIDSVCIPKGTTNKDAAEAFINFLCETEIAVANCEFISYFTPQTKAMEIVGVDERIQPTEEALENSETFVMLGDEANSHMEDLWLQIRSTSMFDSPIYLLALILLLALVIFIILYVVRKKKNSKIDY